MNWKLVAQVAIPVLAAVTGLGVGTQVSTPVVKPDPVVVNCNCPKIPACPSLIVDGHRK